MQWILRRPVEERHSRHEQQFHANKAYVTMVFPFSSYPSESLTQLETQPLEHYNDTQLYQVVDDKPTLATPSPLTKEPAEVTPVKATLVSFEFF